MGFSTFLHAKIIALCSVVPKNGIHLEDELQYFNNDIKKAQRTTKMIGINCRRIAEEGVTAADLCQQAAEHILTEKKIPRDSIDALIFVSQSPDHAIPATACILQDKLKLAKTTIAFDVNQGCTAYTYGLWIASSFIESGACKRVLVLVGESGARYCDPSNRIVTPIFGDCGTATILEYTEKEQKSYFSIGTDGSGAETLIVPAGHSRIPYQHKHEYFQKMNTPIFDAHETPWCLDSTFMDGPAIYEFTMTVVPAHIQELMDFAHKHEPNIDWLVLHQANKQIALNIADKVGFPHEKTPIESLAKYGNQMGASTITVLCDQLCDHINANKINVLISGFGVGLSWASCILELNETWCAGVREFEMPNNHPTIDGLFKYWEHRIKNHNKS